MFEDLKEKLTGPFYTIFTGFRADESIDYESIEKYLVSLYRQGARKFYAMAYNSRYSQLSDQEIKELNEFCIVTLKRLNRDNIVVVGDPVQCSTQKSIEFAQHAKDAGADLISLLVREKYFCDEQILQHYSAIGGQVNMPLLVHEMPFLSGFNGIQMHWPKSLISSLPKIPQIVALKEDAHDFDTTLNALNLEPRIRVIIAGTKAKLLPYKKHGVKAYLNGISIIDAGIGELFWKAFEKDDKSTINFIVEKLEFPFFDRCASQYGWHRTNKALLQAAGFMHRRDRMPLQHLSDEEFKRVRNVYDEIVTAWNTRRGELV